MKIRVVLIAAALAFSAALTSCHKSNQALIDELRQTTTELVDAVKANDNDKVKELSDKMNEIGEELDQRDLTPEEKQQIMQIGMELFSVPFDDYVEQ